MERGRWEADRRDPRVRRRKNPKRGRALAVYAGWGSWAGPDGLARRRRGSWPFEKKKKLEREKEKKREPLVILKITPHNF
jgi:hypothetical protein